jgi:hypothetical protein
MKKLALAVLLFAPLAAVAADKPNPADFTLTVHVISSASASYGTGSNHYDEQVLETSIGGQPVQLRRLGESVLALGDYKARSSDKFRDKHHPSSYDLNEGYELLMPDGTSRTYAVSRLGPAVPNL